jgi:hypothetical protein
MEQGAKSLVDAQWHQIPFIVAADERAKDLMGDIAWPAIPVRDGQRFHDLPAAEVGNADVA